ncbi:MAG: hypothetical protein LBQ34_05415 [Alphaproteobacteria bacterium]|jgi:hypothetical protein|nr:hypothetical protein [Alphaproteobacteria bacterium]
MYLRIILLILILSINSLNASVLAEFKHNFFISFEESQVNNFTENQEPAIKTNNSQVAGYLISKDDIYLGVSFKKFAANTQTYNLQDSKHTEIAISKDSSWQVLLRYNIFEFENIKLLLGVDFGYQSNNINLKYQTHETITVKEVKSNELPMGEIITDTIKKQCDAGINGENIKWDSLLGAYYVSGGGVVCKSYYYVDKEIKTDKSSNLMATSLPISFNFTTLYEVFPNVDLGLSVGLTMVETLNIRYSNQSINLNTKNVSSGYNLALLINFKF